MTKILTEAEVEILETGERRIGKGVPPLREFSADEDKKFHRAGVKCYRLYLEALAGLIHWQQRAEEAEAQVAEHKRLGEMSMGLGPKRGD